MEPGKKCLMMLVWAPETDRRVSTVLETLTENGKRKTKCSVPCCACCRKLIPSSHCVVSLEMSGTYHWLSSALIQGVFEMFSTNFYFPELSPRLIGLEKSRQKREEMSMGFLCEFSNQDSFQDTAAFVPSHP